MDRLAAALAAVGLLLGVLVVFIFYLLILAGVIEGATRHCENIAGEDGVVIKVTIDVFNPASRSCIYADEHGLVHKVKPD